MCHVGAATKGSQPGRHAECDDTSRGIVRIIGRKGMARKLGEEGECDDAWRGGGYYTLGGKGRRGEGRRRIEIGGKMGRGMEL